MAEIVEQVSVRLDAEQRAILDRLQASYPAMSRNGLFIQLLYEWHWNKERGDGKAARLERIEAELAEVKRMVAELYEMHAPGRSEGDMIVNAANQEKFSAYWRDRFDDLDSYESADIRKMIEAAERAFGVTVAPLQAYTLWAEHSDRYAAGWLVYSEAEWLDILREIIQ